jgi:hypothetical protein
VAAGIRAVQIVRAGLDGPELDKQGPDGQVPAAGTTVVRSLPEVAALFSE